MANRLFNRVCELTLKRQGAIGEATEFESITIRDLRVQFQIEKTLEKHPNTCTLTVTNLNADHRANLQRKPVSVSLKAGYQDAGAEQIFLGDMTWCQSVKAGVDWNTKIHIGDGARAMKHARISKSWRGGVTGHDIISAIAKSMGYGLAKSVRSIVELNAQYVSGLVAHGLSRHELTRILARHGLKWSVQDGKLQVLKPDQARDNVVPLINEANGMLGVPEFGTPNEKGDPPTLTVKCLLRPSLTPGDRFLLESQAINGQFKIERLVHSGDTHGGDWMTTIEAKAIR